MTSHCHLLKPFVIPKQVLNNSTTSSSHLLLLPTELLLLIFDTLDTLDQLSLALSCKRLLHMSSDLSLEIPCRGIESYCWSLKETLRLVEPLNRSGKPDKSWGVCGNCSRYRPTRKSYWDGKRRYWVDLDIWGNILDAWNTRSSIECPGCREEEIRLRLNIPRPIDHAQ